MLTPAHRSRSCRKSKAVNSKGPIKEEHKERVANEEKYRTSGRSAEDTAKEQLSGAGPAVRKSLQSLSLCPPINSTSSLWLELL